MHFCSTHNSTYCNTIVFNRRLPIKRMILLMFGLFTANNVHLSDKFEHRISSESAMLLWSFVAMLAYAYILPYNRTRQATELPKMIEVLPLIHWNCKVNSESLHFNFFLMICDDVTSQFLANAHVVGIQPKFAPTRFR